MVFILVTVVALAIHGTHFFSYFFPEGAPKLLAPLIIPIEIISYLSRPVSLSVRLFANMVAGHVMLKVFATFVVMIGSAAGVLGIIGAALPLAGVGCAIRRDMIGRIAELRGGAPFDATSLTEDYELGLTIRALGGRTLLARRTAKIHSATTASELSPSHSRYASNLSLASTSDSPSPRIRTMKASGTSARSQSPSGKASSSE